MSQQPYEPTSGDSTQEFRAATPRPHQQVPPQQPSWPYQPRGMRPRIRVRSTFLTTEFWTFVVVSLGILLAVGIDDGPGELGFSAQDAWKYITWLAIAYILSRGLTKLSGAARDGGESGTEL